jgi:L-alanine-DL-glutamate epimerase-like enolase superfamily enzyme
MKIAHVAPFIVHVPLPRPITDSTNCVDHWGFVGATVTTEDGLSGCGFTGTHAFLPGDRLISEFIGSIYAPLLVNEAVEDVADIARLWKKLYDFPPARWIGRSGISHLALAAVDIALWDLYAKQRRQPLWQILASGRPPSSIEAYDTDAGWLNLPIDELVDGCRRSVDRGFRGVKIKIGSPNPAVDVRRVEAVRRAIGDTVRLMIDGNGRWSLSTALRYAAELDAFGLYWFEEPLDFEDLLSHRELSQTMATPIALGEQLYSRQSFKAFMQLGCVNFVQADAVRLAGITEWVAVADDAKGCGLPVVSHVGDMMQVHQHTAFGHSACSLLEYIPWTLECFEDPARVMDGEFLPPALPGAGTTFRADALRRYSRAVA